MLGGNTVTKLNELFILNSLIMRLNSRVSFYLFCKCKNVLLVQTLTNCNCKRIHMDVAPQAILHRAKNYQLVWG